MSDIIHLLPDSVANQIAAGEVIQRPSSVIKELVENAIDAGASLVQVVVTDAGKSSIQVIDNGCGMSETDARLAFERHATSKISQATDLFALRTMGFRGEALASIAAVAQVELRTRTAAQELGVCLRIEGSRLVEQTPVSCPVGANFCVRNLFFNIPVRRKFLKSNQTEMANIMTEFERIALAHPSVAFKLFNQDALVLDLPAANFHQRIAGIFGRKQSAQLIPLSVDTELARISGFVGSPESSKKKGAPQFFFTNGRYMRHPYFAKAVAAAYEWLIPEGDAVPFFINFEMQPERIDVNIHPTKTEIKFQDEQMVWQILLAAVRDALSRHSAIPTIDFDTQNKPDIPLAPVRMARPQAATPPARPHREANAALLSAYARARNEFEGMPTGDTAQGEPPAPQTLPDFGMQTSAQEKSTAGAAFQLGGKYIAVASEASNLTLIDIRRAHLRILYEQYANSAESKRSLSQGLLFPQEVSLSPAEAAFLKANLTTLKTLGFELTPTEADAFLLRGVPFGTEGLDPAVLLQNVIGDALAEVDAGGDTETSRRMALSLARRAAMPVGVELSAEEMQHLIASLYACQTPAYTPDGHSVFQQITLEEIDGMFKH
ncbi:MAG: DNA mismatch repair endonuclease MutL [Alloprevotella sp.]|nr:DNA mismatch repair endonuclease MutL [Alloprevotella sp.]